MSNHQVFFKNFLQLIFESIATNLVALSKPTVISGSCLSTNPCRHSTMNIDSNKVRHEYPEQEMVRSEVSHDATQRSPDENPTVEPMRHGLGTCGQASVRPGGRFIHPAAGTTQRGEASGRSSEERDSHDARDPTTSHDIVSRRTADQPTTTENLVIQDFLRTAVFSRPLADFYLLPTSWVDELGRREIGRAHV